MNFYEPRQRADNGKWAFTCYNDNQRRAYAVGRCSGIVNGTGADHAHDSPEEAAECHRQYMLDHPRHGRVAGRETEPCRECGAETNAFLEHVGLSGIYFFCDAHRNRETWEKHLVPATGSFGSY